MRTDAQYRLWLLDGAWGEPPVELKQQKFKVLGGYSMSEILKCNKLKCYNFRYVQNTLPEALINKT